MQQWMQFDSRDWFPLHMDIYYILHPLLVHESKQGLIEYVIGFCRIFDAI